MSIFENVCEETILENGINKGLDICWNEESRNLIKIKNGNKPCFTEIKERKKEILGEVTEDGSR